MEQLAVPVSADLIAEIILRSRGRASIVQMIEHSIESFLDRTRGDPDIWSEEHAEEVESETLDDTIARIGYPSKGYRWNEVFLPNGTQLKVHYKGKDYFAEVRHQQVMCDGISCSPSEFASRSASNTSRNAWRDIWVMLPGSSRWEFSDELRRQARAQRR